MAIRKVIESDISGKVDAETVTFGFAGTWYEIDLTDAERKDLEGSLASYLEAARKAAPPAETRTSPMPKTTPAERLQIRKWAEENGIDVPNFGRIPLTVFEAYDKAHNIKR